MASRGPRLCSNILLPGKLLPASNMSDHLWALSRAACAPGECCWLAVALLVPCNALPTGKRLAHRAHSCSCKSDMSSEYGSGTQREAWTTCWLCCSALAVFWPSIHGSSHELLGQATFEWCALFEAASQLTFVCIGSVQLHMQLFVTPPLWTPAGCSSEQRAPARVAERRHCLLLCYSSIGGAQLRPVLRAAQATQLRKMCPNASATFVLPL